MAKNNLLKEESVARRVAYAIVQTGREPWQFRAACADHPHLTDATGGPEVWQALTLCADCPVSQQCLQWATDETAYVGVAGGRIFTPRSRARAQRACRTRRLAEPACPKPFL